MPDINPILDAIDHCLADFSIGGDAMRWSPDAPDPTPVDGLALASIRYLTERYGSRWETIGWRTPVQSDETLRPYREAIDRDIRDLAAVTEIPRLFIDEWVPPEHGEGPGGRHRGTP